MRVGDASFNLGDELAAAADGVFPLPDSHVEKPISDGLCSCSNIQIDAGTAVLKSAQRHATTLEGVLSRFGLYPKYMNVCKSSF